MYGSERGAGAVGASELALARVDVDTAVVEQIAPNVDVFLAHAFERFENLLASPFIGEFWIRRIQNGNTHIPELRVIQSELLATQPMIAIQYRNTGSHRLDQIGVDIDREVVFADGGVQRAGEGLDRSFQSGLGHSVTVNGGVDRRELRVAAEQALEGLLAHRPLSMLPEQRDLLVADLDRLAGGVGN